MSRRTIDTVVLVILAAAALVLPSCRASATPSPALTPSHNAPERAASAYDDLAAAAPGASATYSDGVKQERAYPFEVVHLDYDELRISSEDAFGQLLSLAPDTPHTREQIWLNDLAPFWNLWERAGVARPTAADGPGAYRDGLRSLIHKLPDLGISLEDLPYPISDPWIAGFGDREYAGVVNFFEYTGVDARNVDGMLRTGWGWEQGLSTARPFESLEVVLGQYKASAITEAIASCTDCVPQDMKNYNGIAYMSWGDDYAPGIRNRMKGPFLDHFGRGGRVAVFDGAIYRALSTMGIELLLDTRERRTASLSQDFEYKLAAAGAVALDAYSAVLSSTDFSLEGLRGRLAQTCVAADTRTYGTCQVQVTAETRNALGTPITTSVSGPGPNGWEIAQTSPLLKPFSVAAFASFSGAASSTRGAAIVLVHEDPEAAQANVELLLRRLAETRVPGGELLYAPSIERVEVGAVGRVLLMKLFPKPGLFQMKFLDLPTVTMLPPTVHE